MDELDRCSSEDVVATLTAIRTFLTQKHAVFVVAADRAALERALEEKLPQPTPINEEDPYYSSASSFFDKVFHDRVPLPPLRGPRLYEWAYGTVVGRGGYWAQLHSSSDRELRSLLYFLIPSHVRAPRRVKVLLNSFVRSAAIAAHSGFAWQTRAREIAKLTVLDTEFPALGADLRVEPRLPELLLDPPAEASERVARLLKKHGGYRLAQGPGEHEPPSEEDQEAEVPPDRILAEVSAPERRALVRGEHEHLRRYLARTRDVRIGRDLLFLERAGAALGLEDPELESTLDQAVDVPSDVVSALEKSDAETRRQAARFLADMAEREFGEERANVIAALMGVVELLDSEVELISPEIAGSVQSFARDEGLAEAHLLGALILAISPGVSYVFQISILADPRLFDDAERLNRACRMLQRLPLEARDLAYGALAERVTGDFDAFISMLAEIPPTQAGEALRSRPLYDALFQLLSVQVEEPGENDEFAERVYALAAERGADGAPMRRAMHDLLLRAEIGYQPLQAHAVEVLDGIDEDEERDEQVLKALYFYAYRDVEFWSQQLSEGTYGSPSQGAFAVRIIVNCISEMHQLPPDEVERRLAAVDAISSFVGMAEPAERSRAVDAVVSEIEASPWWSDQAARLRQTHLHLLAIQLAGDEALEAALRPRLAADLIRAVADPAAASEEVWQGMVEMGSGLGSAAEEVLEHLEQFGPLGGEWPLWVTRVRVRLAVTARGGGSNVESEVIADEAIQNAARERGSVAEDAVADWFLLLPPVSAVRAVLSAIDSPPPAQVLTSFEQWVGEVSKTNRTELAVGLVEIGRETSRELDALVRAGVDGPTLVAQIAGRVHSAPRGSRREELMAALAQIRPLEPAAQKAIADLIIELTETGKQIDFKAAARAIPALGREHRSAGRLRTAFQRAADEHGNQLSERAAVQLTEAGVKVPKKAVKKGAWGRVKDLFS